MPKYEDTAGRRGLHALQGQGGQGHAREILGACSALPRLRAGGRQPPPPPTMPPPRRPRCRRSYVSCAGSTGRGSRRRRSACARSSALDAVQPEAAATAATCSMLAPLDPLHQPFRAHAEAAAGRRRRRRRRRCRLATCRRSSSTRRRRRSSRARCSSASRTTCSGSPSTPRCRRSSSSCFETAARWRRRRPDGSELAELGASRDLDRALEGLVAHDAAAARSCCPSCPRGVTRAARRRPTRARARARSPSSRAAEPTPSDASCCASSADEWRRRGDAGPQPAL